MNVNEKIESGAFKLSDEEKDFDTLRGEIAKIVAVTNIVVNTYRSMNVHEPAQIALMAGVNQLYAEVCENPGDVKSDTEKGRGFMPDKEWETLWEAEYKPGTD